ncbi:uncharacterized protein [Pleurodeles waltl]|uniref:uncharacterized protein isoform X1 n=1 Tax=Pleurodeles waltl TaxID=8319 RepID=UPI003709A6E2
MVSAELCCSHLQEPGSSAAMKWSALLLLCFQVFSSGADHHQPIHDASCNDPKVFDAVDLALKKYNAGRKEGNQFALRRITEAGTTGVHGSEHYHVTYEIIESTCAAQDGHVWQDCQLKPRAEAAIGVCHAEVHISSTEKPGNVISQECSITPKLCRGCPLPIWSDDARLQPITMHAIHKFNYESNDRHYYKLESISKATRQVVAGIIYKLEYKIKETDCDKNEVPDLHSGCKPLNFSGTCKASVHITLDGSIGKTEQNCHMSAPVPACPGCPTPISSNSEELKPIMKTIIENLNKMGRLNLYKLEVQSVTSQVVAGTRYRIQYRYRETDCPKSKFNEVHPGCKPLDDYGSCTATVHVAPNGSIASFGLGCVPPPLVHSCVGCPNPISGNSEELKPILKFIIGKINEGSGRPNLLRLEAVKQATSQVVAGTRYEITYTFRETDCLKSKFKEVHPGCIPLEHHGSCKATVHVALNGSITGFEQGCVLAPPVAGCRGCHRPISSDSEELKPILEHCIHKFNHESDQLNLFKLGVVKKATSQVVAGRKYNIDFSIMETNCSKKEFKELHGHCSAHKLSGACKSSVFVALNDSIAVTQQNCGIHAPSPPCTGCPKPLETNSTRLVEPLAHTLKKYNSESNDPVLYKVDHIEKATAQIVAGTKYAVTFTIKPTNCSKESNEDLHAGCHIDATSGYKRCEAVIVVVPWLKKVEPLKVSCSETEYLPAILSIPGLSPFRTAALVKYGDGHASGHRQGHQPEPFVPVCPRAPWKPKAVNPSS